MIKNIYIVFDKTLYRQKIEEAFNKLKMDKNIDEDKNITYTNIAEELNLPVSTVRQWFDDRKSIPNSDNLKKIIDFFHIKNLKQYGIKDEQINVFPSLIGLKALLKANNIKQVDFAKHLDIDKTEFNKMINGKKNTSIDYLEKFSDFFDVSIDYIIKGVSPDKNIVSETRLSNGFFDTCRILKNDSFPKGLFPTPNGKYINGTSPIEILNDLVTNNSNILFTFSSCFEKYFKFNNEYKNSDNLDKNFFNKRLRKINDENKETLRKSINEFYDKYISNIENNAKNQKNDDNE